jgi:hypothetical protein
MEGVNTVFVNFNENWHPGGLSCANREMSRFAAHIRPYKLEGTIIRTLHDLHG